jgi:hypothetical protein
MSNFYLSVFGLVVALGVVIKATYILSSKMMVEEIAALFAFLICVIALAFHY